MRVSVDYSNYDLHAYTTYAHVVEKDKMIYITLSNKPSNELGHCEIQLNLKPDCCFILANTFKNKPVARDVKYCNPAFYARLFRTLRNGNFPNYVIPINELHEHLEYDFPISKDLKFIEGKSLAEWLSVNPQHAKWIPDDDEIIFCKFNYESPDGYLIFEVLSRRAKVLYISWNPETNEIYGKEYADLGFEIPQRDIYLINELVAIKCLDQLPVVIPLE